MTLETCQRIEATLNQWLRVCYLHNRDGVPVNSPWIDGLPQCAGVIAAEIDRLQRELDEARAEVERLRPAAEAWEAHEAHLYADKHARTYAETSEARANYVAAAARARAAKVTP